MSHPVRPTVQVLLDADWAAGSLVEDVRRGLGSRPLTLPPKWLYDDEGSRLFDEITRLPEYYPTETERAILARHAADVVAASDATTLVELGSGTSDKTRMLLDGCAVRLTSFRESLHGCYGRRIPHGSPRHRAEMGLEPL